jgi:L-threonylcarbamoyladenylate synthase
MEIINQTELKLKFDKIIEKIRDGSLFIHPTDTIYGIGCNSLDREAVSRVRKIKQRETEPFSIWVPSLDWVNKNCNVNEKAKEWLSRLPGPYTIIIPLKNKNSIAKNVAPGLDAVGIRSPEHWFSQVVQAVGVPIITTSANKVGEPFMTSIEDLDSGIKEKIEFIIYEGEKKARPSKIVHLEKDEVNER